MASNGQSQHGQKAALPAWQDVSVEPPPPIAALTAVVLQRRKLERHGVGASQGWCSKAGSRGGTPHSVAQYSAVHLRACPSPGRAADTQSHTSLVHLPLVSQWWRATHRASIAHTCDAQAASVSRYVVHTADGVPRVVFDAKDGSIVERDDSLVSAITRNLISTIVDAGSEYKSLGAAFVTVPYYTALQFSTV